MTQIATSKNTAAMAPARPRRALGLWAAMALVIGNMIGSGIFCSSITRTVWWHFYHLLALY